MSSETDLKERLDKLLTVLKEKEIITIRKYFGLESGKTHTYKEIGMELGCSIVYVSKLKVKALQKLAQTHADLTKAS